MELITSRQNAKIKALKKLARRSGRRKAGAYLLEGPHLVGEAIQSGADILGIYAAPEAAKPEYQAYPLTYISSDLAQYLSQTEHSQQVFAEVALPAEEEAFQKGGLPNELGPALLILDGIQDPGNLGTLIRTADALGYQDVLVGRGTVDLYNDKVLRAMQGSNFHLRLYPAELERVLPVLAQAGYYLAATELNPQAQSLDELDLTAHGQWGLVLGNEGNGVRPEILALADTSLYIPMQGQAESLNVAVAGAIAMYANRPRKE